MEATRRKQSYLGENPNSRLLLITDQRHPRLRIRIGNDDSRVPMEVDAVEFVGVKGFKAKGKRLTTDVITQLQLLDPLTEDEEEATEDVESLPDKEAKEENLDPDAGKSQQQVIDEITGQLNLFDTDEN